MATGSVFSLSRVAVLNWKWPGRDQEATRARFFPLYAENAGSRWSLVKGLRLRSLHTTVYRSPLSFIGRSRERPDHLNYSKKCGFRGKGIPQSISPWSLCLSFPWRHHLKDQNRFGLKKKAILTAYGIARQGKGELIDFTLVRHKREYAWVEFFLNLLMRGLAGTNLRLVITDGN